MSWNYRVMRQTLAGEPSWGVHEVFYTEAGEVRDWTREPVGAAADSLAEVCELLARMTKATRLPTLDFETGQPAAGPPPPARPSSGDGRSTP